MKNICFISGDISRSGGTERVLSLIANELVKDYNIYILSYGLEKKSYFYLRDNIKILNLFKNKCKILNKINAVFFLRKIIKKKDIDIIIDVDIILSINSILATRGLKTRVYSWEHFNYFNNMGIKRRTWARILAAKYSDYIITLTNEDKKNFTKNLRINNKIEYIYNPTPFENVKRNKGISKIAISVGRLTKVKGFDRLLNIWSEIEKKDDEWKLYVIGNGEEGINLYNQIKKLNLKRVKIIEHTANIKKYYEKASLYLMTSRFEGLPMTLIEAQSFGIPIISYDIHTGPRDIVKHSYNGFLIKDNDQDEFSNKILELINNRNKLNEFSEYSYKNSKRFGIKKIKDKWLDILKDSKGE